MTKPEAVSIGEERGVLLIPGAKVASRWNGALRSRLNRAPLEAFLRIHQQPSDLNTPPSVVENLVCACVVIIEPVLPHRGKVWVALCQQGYFDALGEAVALISRALSELIQESQPLRVASLVGVARLLTPNLGLDLAAAAAAAAVAAGESEQRPAIFAESLGVLAATAVISHSDADLNAVRDLIRRGFAGIVEGGASKLLSAPRMTTIWTEPPSNY